MHTFKILSAVLLLGGLAACKKKDDPKVAGNTWTLDGTTYKVHHAGLDSNRLDVWEEDADYAASFVFGQIPERSGKYKVVGRESFSGEEVVITCIRKNSAGIMEAFLSKRQDASVYADVSVAGGKTTIAIDPVWVFNSPLDSALFSCKLVYEP